jgi:hypothetical protein
VRGSSRKCAAITALAFAGVIAAGCSKKNDYGADTSAITTDSTSATYSASSTVPATQDTAAIAGTSKSSGTKSTTKKTTTKKTTY